MLTVAVMVVPLIVPAVILRLVSTKAFPLICIARETFNTPVPAAGTNTLEFVALVNVSVVSPVKLGAVMFREVSTNAVPLIWRILETFNTPVPAAGTKTSEFVALVNVSVETPVTLSAVMFREVSTKAFPPIWTSLEIFNTPVPAAGIKTLKFASVVNVRSLADG